MTKEQIQEFTLKVSQANDSGLMIILFDVERIHLLDALSAYEAEDISAYLRSLELAKKAHNELMSGVNGKDRAGAGMLSVLRYIYKMLVTSTVKRKPVELSRCMDMMDKLKVCFEKINEIDTSKPVMKNTHQVYAGLTYGRGTLNESIQGVDYKNRGYQA